MGTLSRSVLHLRDLGENRVTAILNDRISRAFLLENGARELALAENARLVTELRTAKVWPARFQPDQDDE